MKLHKKFIVAIILSCLIILIESCSSSVLVVVWNDTSYHESPLNKILIIAIRKDSVQRRIWEDAFVGELSKHGVKATSSYDLFPKVLPVTNQIIQTIQGNNFDGILMTRLLHKETEIHYVESSLTSEVKSKYSPFRKIYSTYYQDVQHPEYVDSQKVNYRTIGVWAIRYRERIIWGATSNTPERNSVEAVRSDIADLVIPQLVRNAIIKSEE